MTTWDWVRVIGIVGPILLMFLIGFTLTIRSGVAQLASAHGMRRAFENTSSAILLVVGCLVGLAMVHQLVGLRVGVSW